MLAYVSTKFDENEDLVLSIVTTKQEDLDNPEIINALNTLAKYNGCLPTDDAFTNYSWEKSRNGHEGELFFSFSCDFRYRRVSPLNDDIKELIQPLNIDPDYRIAN